MTVASQNIRIEPNAEGGPNTKVSRMFEGEVVSWTWIVPMTIRVGESTVRMDGIGGVETLELHRNKGYSRQVLTAALAHMEVGDAPLTTLYGIPSYYPRWGYATVGHEGGIRLTRLDVDIEFLPGYRMRAARLVDFPRIRTLYNDATRNAIGALVRDDTTPSWQTLEKSLAAGDDECRVIVDDTDEVLAYAWKASSCWWIETRIREDANGLHIGEAFAISPRAADALLAGLRQWAIESDKEHVDLHQPWLGAVGMSARLQETSNLTLTFREAQFMGRSIGTDALLRAIEHELRQRWTRVVSEWTGALRINTGDRAATIALGTGTLVIGRDDVPDAIDVQLSPGDLARLVFGSFQPIDLLDRIGVSRDIADVLAILFPEQRPYVYPADRF